MAVIVQIFGKKSNTLHNNFHTKWNACCVRSIFIDKSRPAAAPTPTVRLQLEAGLLLGKDDRGPETRVRVRAIVKIIVIRASESAPGKRYTRAATPAAWRT